MKTLWHATACQKFAHLKVGEEVTLIPGPQGAQGVGVYFSEGRPDIRAADSVAEHGLAAVFMIEIQADSSWYRSKRGMDRKKNRPRTWHSAGRAVRIRVTAREVTPEGTPIMRGVGEVLST